MVALALISITVISVTLGAAIFYGDVIPWGHGGMDGDAMWPYEGIVIREPTSWDRLNTTLEERVAVRNDARLTIRDSDLTIMIEDMLLRGAGFDVQTGCMLRLDRTHLTLVSDPRSDGAAALWGHGASDFYHRGFTSLSRVVNLGQAMDPVLELDVCWKVPAHLIVAVQRSPTAPLERYATLSPFDTGPMAWRHHSIPLSNLTGGIVRLALILEERIEGYVLVNGIKVLDGRGPLLGDRFGTGSMIWNDYTQTDGSDGWFGDPPGGPTINLRDPYAYLGLIVRSQGDLILTSSSLEARGTIPRSPLYNGELCTKGRNTYCTVGDEGALNFISALSGGAIEAWGGTLTVRDSSLDDVPLLARTERTELSRTTFRGGTDLVTLARSDGVVEGCRFIHEPLPSQERDALFGLASDNRPLWSLSIDGVTGGDGARVQGCDFVGGEVALDLNLADVDLEGCNFTGVAGLAIWDHETLGGWGNVSASNRFVDCQGDLYLGTRTINLETRFSGTPFRDPGPVALPILASEVIKDPHMFDVRVFGWSSYYATICVPRQIVDANGAVEVVGTVTVDLPLGHGASKEIVLDTGAQNRTVDFVSSDLSPDLMMSRGHVAPLDPPSPSDAPGSVDLVVRVDTHRTHDQGPLVTFKLDDKEEWSVDANSVNELAPNPYREGSSESALQLHVVRKTVPLPAGEHTVRIRYAEYDLATRSYFVGMNLTLHFFRLTIAEDTASLSTFVEEHADGWLVVDPGLDVRLDANVTGPMLERGPSALHFLLFEGAKVTIMDLTETGSALDITSIGDGELEVGDAGLGALAIESKGNKVTIDNITSMRTTIELEGGSCLARDVSCAALGLGLSDLSTMVLEDSKIDATDAAMTSHASLIDSGLRMANVTFRASHGVAGGSDLDASLEGGSSLAIEGSRFDGCSLKVVHDGELDWMLEVVGCDFAAPAVLSVDESYDWAAYGNLKDPQNATGRIDNNTFDGAASGLVLMMTHGALPGHDNAFLNGARFMAHYRPDYPGKRPGDVRYIPEFVGDMLGMAWSVLDGEVAGERWDVFVDLGEDLSKLASPKSVTLMVISPGDTYSNLDAGTIWFTKVDPTAKVLMFIVPDWGTLEGLIWPLRNP